MASSKASNEVKRREEKKEESTAVLKKDGGEKNMFEMASKHHFQLSPDRKQNQSPGLLRPKKIKSNKKLQTLMYLLNKLKEKFGNPNSV